MWKLEFRIAYELTLIVLAAIVVGTRLFVRYAIQEYGRSGSSVSQRVAWIMSDCFAVLAFAVSLSAAALDTAICVKKIRYRDTGEDLPEDVVTLSQKAMFYNTFVLLTGLWAIKASLLASFFMTFKHVSGNIRGMLRASVCLLYLSYLAMFVMNMLWCGDNFSSNWSIGPNFCRAQISMTRTVIFYALNYLTDLPLILIPFFIFRFAPGDRYALGFLYFLGLITIGFSSLSFALHLSLRANSQYQSSDAIIEKIYLVCCGELLAGMLVACLPSIRVLFRGVRRGTTEDEELETSRSSRHYSKDNSLAVKPSFSTAGSGA